MDLMSSDTVNKTEKKSQSFDEDLTELRKLSKDCQFENVDKKTLYRKFRTVALIISGKEHRWGSDMNLKTLLDIIRTQEIA